LSLESEFPSEEVGAVFSLEAPLGPTPSVIPPNKLNPVLLELVLLLLDVGKRNLGIILNYDCFFLFGNSHI
jgi:hypothetical protein